MWKEEPVFLEDMQNLCKLDYIPWEQLRGKNILVTGATGLIGQTLVSGLLYAGEHRHLDLTVTALVRSRQKAVDMFKAQLEEGLPLKLLEGSVENLPEVKAPVDYIVHGASPTASKWFVEHPVETIQTAVVGTMNMLELARKKRVKGFVYLSSMEVYGFPEKGTHVTEENVSGLATTIPRNSYPISKQLCECLCCSYAAEYAIPAKVVRLTQTFGPGVSYADARIFAEFARCVIEHKDIVLKTKGETERSYLYTADAVSAILTIMLKGQAGAVYNAANESTYCSISQMAEQVSKIGAVDVRYQTQDVQALGYAPTLYMNLDVSKLKSLGWMPKTGLEQMYKRMIEDMQEKRKHE